MFFKIIGIYVTCAVIHDFFNDPEVPKELKKKYEEIISIKNGKKEENGKKPKEEKFESAFVHHVVKNRIGF